MAGSSSSSSSSSSSAPKKRKKEKASKKGKKKKDKKSKKESKKAAKEAKAAEKRERGATSWECDRAEAVRLVGQLLALEAGIDSALAGIFESIDDGDVVRIDGLEHKQAKKKLRHLLKTLKLSEIDGGFKTASKKVSFAALFKSCLAEAKRSTATARAVPEHAAAMVSAAASFEAAAAKYCRPEDATDGPDNDGPASPGEAAPAPVAVPRKVGPQLPGASVGPSADAEESSDDDAGGPGPRLAGEERQGIDLSSMPQRAKREDWMTTAHSSIAAAFADCPGGPRKADRYEVVRSTRDQEAFEKMYRDRGPSLLEQKQSNKFAGHEEEMERAKKKRNTMEDLWGVAAKEQGRMSSTGGAGEPAARVFFDPEKDFQSGGRDAPMSSEDFSKLVEKSVAGLGTRFGRGNIATSFL